MIKKHIYIITVLILISSLSGCKNSNVTDINTDTIVQNEIKKNIEYNQYLISPYIKEYINPDEELYKRLVDAINNYETEIVLSEALSEDSLIRLRDSVPSRGEFPYISSLKFDKKENKIIIVYSNYFTKEEAMAYKDSYINRMNEILNKVINLDGGEVEMTLAIYEEMAKGEYYINPDEIRKQSDLIVTGTGICTDYAYGMRSILDQLGIENHLAFSNKDGHVWNVVKIDDEYYHLDATWGSRGNNDVSYWSFGSTDDIKATHMTNWVGGGNSNYPYYELPKCTSTRFNFLENSIKSSVNYESNEILYTTIDGDERIYNIKTGEDILLKTYDENIFD